MLCLGLLAAVLTFANACKPKNTDDKATQSTAATTTSADSTGAAAALTDTLAATTAENSAGTPDTTSSTAAATTTDLGLTKSGAALPSGVKWGYINSLELLAMMPETKQADQKLEELQRSKESAFKSLMDKYQKGAAELQEKGQDMTRIEQEAKMKEMGELENRLSQMQMSSGDEIAAEKEKLYAPILKKADKYIKQVGKEQGYAFILDATSLLYADESRNLLPAVKGKMGLK